MCLCAVSAFLNAWTLLFNWNFLSHWPQMMFFSKACLCLCLSCICVYKYRGVVAKGGPVVRPSRAAECKGRQKWGVGGDEHSKWQIFIFRPQQILNYWGKLILMFSKDDSCCLGAGNVFRLNCPRQYICSYCLCVHSQISLCYYCRYVASNGRVGGEWWRRMDLKGSSRGIYVVVSWYLPGRNEYNH